MQRTVKATKIDVVMFENGQPVVKNITIPEQEEKAIQKYCKNNNILPNMATAKKIDVLYKMDDTFFFENAEIVSTTEEVNENT